MAQWRKWGPMLVGAALVMGQAPVDPPPAAVRTQAEPGRAAPDTLRVITHTREYCSQLSARAADLRREVAGTNEEALQLAQEGDRLCLQGQIRPGISRLRRALMLLHAQPRLGSAGP